ncbi:MAG: B12-binding domain-containing radical SAM protein [Clostridia bacterium]|nr:B12-binding domain-containing radical SAM protein [Clostridia bacterium]
MSNVVFVTPNYSESYRSEPIGTLILATILRKAGIESEIVHLRWDCDAEDQGAGQLESFLQTMEACILETGASIVSFYTRCDMYHLEIKLAQRLKENHPNLYIIFGGPQSDLCAEDTLQNLPWIDYICRGEGETTVVPFFRSLLEGKPDETIQGLAFMRDGRLVINERPPMIDDLDSLPTIDFSLMKAGKNRKKTFSVDVGRGCPFACTYCSTKSFWHQHYRLKSAERIVEEIKTLHEQFGANRFIFEHDMFTMNKIKVLKICKMIKELDFPITWYCSARMDCIDEELIDAMHDAGMTNIFFGVETGSPRMQKLVNKNLKLDEIAERLASICSKGISVVTSFIYGFPQETEEDLSQTIDLCADLVMIPGLEVDMHLCTFLPGTELHNQYRDELSKNSFTPNLVGNFGATACADLISAYPKLFSQFYEYTTSLRQRLRYLNMFMTTFEAFKPIYRYLKDTRYADRLSVEMYYDWAAANEELLRPLADQGSDTYHTPMLLAQKDRFLSCFTDDSRFELLKEVARFIGICRFPNAENGTPAAQVAEFGFSADDYFAGKAIEDYRPGKTVSYVMLGEDGKFRIKNMASYL